MVVRRETGVGKTLLLILVERPLIINLKRKIVKIHVAYCGVLWLFTCL